DAVKIDVSEYSTEPQRHQVKAVHRRKLICVSVRDIAAAEAQELQSEFRIISPNMILIETDVEGHIWANDRSP
ncbi:hypothetical protein PFISCL1PPCAC_680, partial [Pristionchus fissidentatus]